MTTKNARPPQKPLKMKKKRIPAPPGQPSDAELIAAFFKNGGKVTQYKTGIAEGAMYSSDQGLGGSR